MSRTFKHIEKLAGVALLVACALLLAAGTASADPGHGKGHGKGHWKHHGKGHGADVTVVQVVETGTIEVANRTGLPFAVRLDGQQIGTVYGGSHLLVAQALAGPHTVEARPLGAGYATTEVFHPYLQPGERARLVLNVHLGAIHAVNRQGVRVELIVNGNSQGYLMPGAARRVDGLRPGMHEVVFAGTHGVLATSRVEVRPDQVVRFVPAAMPGTVRIHNDGPVPMKVWVAGRKAGRVLPGATLVLSGLTPGPVVVELRSKRGLSATRTLHVGPGQVASWTFDAPAAHHHAGRAWQPGHVVAKW